MRGKNEWKVFRLDDEKNNTTYPQYFVGTGALSGTQRLALGAEPATIAAVCHSTTDLMTVVVVRSVLPLRVDD